MRMNRSQHPGRLKPRPRSCPRRTPSQSQSQSRARGSHGCSRRPDLLRTGSLRSVEKAERDLILRQGVVLPETPRQRRERAALEDDLQTIALTGKPLPVRARHFRPTAEAYLVATRGPLPYMLRLREIEQRTEAHESMLRAEWLALAEACAAEPARFRSEGLAPAGEGGFREGEEFIDN